MKDGTAFAAWYDHIIEETILGSVATMRGWLANQWGLLFSKIALPFALSVLFFQLKMPEALKFLVKLSDSLFVTGVLESVYMINHIHVPSKYPSSIT